MKKYGCDKETGVVWSWDGNFHLEENHSIFDNSSVSIDRVNNDIIGCSFLSGWTGNFIVIRSDGYDHKYFLIGWESKTGYWIGQNVSQEDLKRMSSNMGICICGKIVKSPEKMSEICSRFPNSRMYACPVVEELSSFGVLIRNLGIKRPYRAILSWDNKDIIEAPSKEFDPKLEGDSMGQMAEIVNGGLPVVNEVMKTVGISAFYGNIIHNGLDKSQEWKKNPVHFIVRIAEIDHLFPGTPISAKKYVATSVPIKMETTKQFRAETGYNEQFADVFVSTDYTPGISTFMRFYKSFSRKGFVYVSKNKDVINGLTAPVFRSDRAYRVLKEKI